MSDENSPVVTFQRRRKVRRALLDANVRECSEVETRASPLPWCPLVSPLVPIPTHNFVTATRQPAQGRPNLAKSTEHAKAKDSKPNQANVKTAKTVDLTSDSSTLPAGNTTATGSGRQQPPGRVEKDEEEASFAAGASAVRAPHFDAERAVCGGGCVRADCRDAIACRAGPQGDVVDALAR